MSAGFVFREGSSLFFKGRRISFAAAAIFAVVLSIIGIFALGTFYLVSFKNEIESRLEVVVFLAPHADSEELIREFETIEGVVSGSAVSSEQALEEFRRELGKDAELLDILDENPLPPSIRLKLTPEYRSRAQLGDLEEKLALFEGVQEVWVDRNLLDRLNTFLYILLGADAFVLLLVGLSAVLVTMLATRFAILDRRRIIDLYWLMGVHPRTLRAPYVIEGLLEGLFGSIVAYGIVFVLHLILSPLLGSMSFPFWELAAALLGLGLVFGWLGSGLAIDAFKLKRT
jgi:cell division transport system permease protein